LIAAGGGTLHSNGVSSDTVAVVCSVLARTSSLAPAAPPVPGGYTGGTLHSNVDHEVSVWIEGVEYKVLYANV
jgi:hypothetical protein